MSGPPQRRPPAATPGGASSPAASAEEPAICGHCGVIVDASRKACATCDAVYATPPSRAVAQPGGGYWVAVRATFTCNACRFDVPLNHFELDDGVVCTRCGLEQRYDPSGWRDLADFAHSVGDFGAPGPEGRMPDPHVRLRGPKPFADLGVAASWAVDGRFRASPGNPLCRTCKAPRVVIGRRDRVLDVACSTCRERHTYELPGRTGLKHLAGVLADEHEQGRREATLVDENGVSVLRCPNCSAPLSGVKDEDGIVTCGYCHVACRISSHTHARVGHKATPIKTWWLYFEQPSTTRRKLVAEAKQDAARAEKRRARDAQRATSPAPPGASVGAGRDERVATATRDAKKAARRAALPLLAVMLSAPIIGGIIWFQSHERDKAKVAAAAALPSDELLGRYSFSMTPSEAGALFGVEGKPGADVRFKEPGVFKRAGLGGTGGPTYRIDLLGGAKLDTRLALARLGKIAPNRLRAQANGQSEINVGRTLLRVDPRPTPMYTTRIEVMTWVEGKPGIAAADAFLAAARYAAMGGPELTPAQLELLNGPSLTGAARFDAATPIEQASTRFAAAFPTGKCTTTTDLMSKRTELACIADVDDPIFGEVRFAWPSAPKTHLRQATLVKLPKPKGGGRAPPDPTDCLTKELGPGDRKVVDFASGRAVLSWPLGKRGDRAILDADTFSLRARDGADPDAPTDWAKDYPKILNALLHCAR